MTTPTNQLIHKAIAECVGVFALVFAGCGAIMVAERFTGSIAPGVIPVVFGLIITAMIYAVGHISGAHFNPAVTIAFCVARHFPVTQVFVYIFAQCFGGLLGVGLLSALLPTGELYGATVPHVSMLAALGWEIVLTFILMFVVIGVATDTRAVGVMAGVAVGATVMLCAFVGGPVTGASMNPARSLGPALFEGRLDVFWIYVVGPIIGAVVAALFYQWIRCDSSEDKSNVQGCC